MKLFQLKRLLRGSSDIKQFGEVDGMILAKPRILRGKQLMRRKEYCESSSVQEFIKWISYLIDKEDSFTHTYIVAKTKEKWECNSIYSAFENYMWPFYYIDSNGKRICGNSFWDSEKVLNKCSSQLKFLRVIVI